MTIRTVSASGLFSPALVAAAILASGCGAAGGPAVPPKSTGGAAVSAAPTASSGSASSSTAEVSDADAAHAVCALFSRDQAQAVAGDNPLADAPGPDFGTDPTSGLGSVCLWSTPPPQEGVPGLPVFELAYDDGSLPVARTHPANHPQPERIKGNLFSAKDTEAVSGLGDEAYYQPKASGGGALFVRRGTKYVCIMPGLGTFPADLKQREIDLARAVLSKV